MTKEPATAKVMTTAALLKAMSIMTKEPLTIKDFNRMDSDIPMDLDKKRKMTWNNP